MQILMIFAMVFFVGHVVRERARSKWIAEMRALAHRSVNRNRFGELRTRLLELARTGQTSVSSPVFGMLYKSLTIFMRNPLDYEKAATAILTLPAISPQPSGVVSHSAGERRLIVDFADALDSFCRDYSRAYRWVAWFLDRVEKRRMPLWVSMHAQKQARAQSGSRLHTVEPVPDSSTDAVRQAKVEDRRFLMHLEERVVDRRRLRPVWLARRKLEELSATC